MKRVFAVLTILAVLTGLLGGCSKDPEKMLSNGNYHAKKGEYEKAYEYYRQAGDAGKEKIKELVFSQADGISDKNDYFKVALRYLDNEGAELFTEEEKQELLAQRLGQIVEEENRSAEAIKPGDGEAWKACAEELWRIMDSAEETIKEGTPGREEAMNAGYTLLGMKEIESEAPDYSGIIWYDVKKYWGKCTAGTGYEVMQAIEEVENGDMMEGVRVLTEKFENKEVLLSLWETIPRNTEYTSTNDILAMNGVERMFAQDEAELTLTEALKNIETWECGTGELDGSVNVPEEWIPEIEASIGKNQEGKILILHDRYTGMYLDVAIGMMQFLPDRYYPSSLESVRYVILLQGDSVRTGLEYTGGTVQIREDTTVRLIDLTTGAELMNGLENGPTSAVMSYTGTQPKFYSAGAPSIYGLLKEACQIIENN